MSPTNRAESLSKRLFWLIEKEKALYTLTRRNFLRFGVASSGALLSACKTPLISEPRLLNPCEMALPQHLVEHPLVTSAFEGLDPQQLWDAHVHLVGTGDGDSGIELSSQLFNPIYMRQYTQRLLYMNAGCVHEVNETSVDRAYITRLRNLMDALPEGVKLLLLAFDRSYRADGTPLRNFTSIYVPNDYTQRVAALYPQRMEWACSIHPYREDAVTALRSAAAAGARAVKWLPPAMGMDPSSPRCDPFYDELARLRLPLLTHTGEEHAVEGAAAQALGNPLLLRRALERGVVVIMAHCATLGSHIDLDEGKDGPEVSSFTLFRRMMENPDYHGLLYGDLSAITLRNRPTDVIAELLEREAWHPRLLFGSDYPLPGILPLTSLPLLARAGLLDGEAVMPLAEIRRHNPILFDLILKRNLRSKGRGFSVEVFENKRVFMRDT